MEKKRKIDGIITAKNIIPCPDTAEHWEFHTPDSN